MTPKSQKRQSDEFDVATNKRGLLQESAGYKRRIRPTSTRQCAVCNLPNVIAVNGWVTKQLSCSLKSVFTHSSLQLHLISIAATRHIDAGRVNVIVQSRTRLFSTMCLSPSHFLFIKCRHQICLH